MLTPCTCNVPGGAVAFTPSEIGRIYGLAVCPPTISAMSDRVEMHGHILNGRRYLCKCPHNRDVLTGEARRTAVHNPKRVDAAQLVLV